jgi:two-component system, OmpR family, phosphate regulon sensor histidine kinase PhoR
MSWILLCLIAGLAIAFGYVAWRKWIAPWRKIEELIDGIGQARKPRTFLAGGGRIARRVGLALEEIFNRQQQLTRQLAEGASGTETILAAMQDGLLVVDAARHITLANESFAQFFGLRETSPGAPLLEMVRDVTLDRLITKTLHTGEPTRCEITTPERQLEVSAVPMKDESGATTGVVVLFHDITQLKQLDEVRKDFVANVSHELRTPLSILRGYIETLRDNPKIPAGELARILGVMERHSKRLGFLVEDLLTLTQLESSTPNLQLSDVSVNNLVRGVVHDWEKKFEDKNLRVIVDLAPDVPIIRADEARLQEVLYNLLDNAVKYSRAGAEICLHAHRRDGQVALSVSDTGIGIGEEDLPRIFERFYRVDKARSSELGGTGLGLSIVKHIAQLHGGRVEAESQLGRGTTIRVLLPGKNTAKTGGVTET